MSKLLIFAGTTEGRELAEYLQRQELACTVCVATEYGESLLEEEGTIHRVQKGRLNQAEMEALFAAEKITHVVDATHPYAAVVTDNIRRACAKTDAAYIRLLRASSAEEPAYRDYISVDSIDAAIDFLKDKEGIVFAATGSKELAKYTALPHYEKRVVARILSTSESMNLAASAGFMGKNLICMQGPFSEELNTAMLRACHASWMVTKESGRTGGFPEKVRAAKAAGVRLIVVGRPSGQEGLSPEQVRRRLSEIFPLARKRRIALVGIGMGTAAGMTREAWEVCAQADVLIGARRMLKAAESLNKPVFAAYRSEEIRAFADSHPEYEKFAVLLSGDVGFYSGAKKLEEVFAGEKISVCSGISSVVYLCGQLHTSWEDVKLISLHGRSQNLIAAVRENRKVFALVGKEESLHSMCRELLAYGLGDTLVHVGCELSYPEEKILSGSPEQLKDCRAGDLTAVLIENPHAAAKTTHGLRDEVFDRGRVPMTKDEVRSVSLSRLDLHRDSVIYDVGAGTGSVSIEMALCAAEGSVYAIERNSEAAALIRQNAVKLGVPNLEIIEGLAPEALKELPAPTHAFIGGSAGNMRQILEAILAKNKYARIVINAIALETLSEVMEIIKAIPLSDVEISCVQASRAKSVGSYHMMMGQNPVYVISFTGADGGAL